MTKNAARREKFRKIGAAVSAIKERPYVIDHENRQAMNTPHPWKVLPSAGFFTQQIDTRQGIPRKAKPK